MKTLIFCLAQRDQYRKIIISENEIFLSPDEPDPNGTNRIRLESSQMDMQTIMKKYPHLANPDLIFIKTDATRRNLVNGITRLNCPSVISIADTHHLYRPIECLQQYLASEEFTVVSVENDRHHLKWYSRYVRPGHNLYWFPNFAFNPIHRIFNAERVPRVVFAGSLGRFHPYRRHVVESLQKASYPIDALSCSQENAASHYSNYLISLNVSLNQDLNWRFFEIISSGGFLLTDRLNEESGISKIFTEGIHYEAFGDQNELYYKVNYYLSNPKKAIEISRRGCQHYWDTLSPKILRKELIKSAFGLSVDHKYTSPQYGSIDCLQHYVRAYQSLQEIHRISPQPLFIFSPRIDPILINEVRLLKRSTICFTSSREYSLGGLQNQKKQATTLICVDNSELNQLPDWSTDVNPSFIVFTRACGDNIMVRLQRNDYIYNKGIDCYARN